MDAGKGSGANNSLSITVCVPRVLEMVGIRTATAAAQRKVDAVLKARVGVCLFGWPGRQDD